MDDKQSRPYFFFDIIINTCCYFNVGLDNTPYVMKDNTLFNVDSKLYTG